MKASHILGTSLKSIRGNSIFVMDKKTWTDTSQRKIYKWPINKVLSIIILEENADYNHIKFTIHSVEWIKLKILTTPRVGKNVWQPESSSFDNDCVNWYNHFGKGLTVSYKIKHIHNLWPSNPTYVYSPKRNENIISTKRYIQECSDQLYSSLTNFGITPNVHQ